MSLLIVQIRKCVNMEVPMDEPLAKGYFGVTKRILKLRAGPGRLFGVYSNRVFEKEMGPQMGSGLLLAVNVGMRKS